MATTKTFKVFLCEIVAPSRRGLAAAMYYVSYSCGIFLVLFLNLFLHWRLVMVVPAIMALPIFAALYKLRDSPVWLQRMGNMRAAKEAEAFYRLSLLTLEEGLSCKMQESEKTLMEKLESGLLYLYQQGSQFWLNFASLTILSFLFGWCVVDFNHYLIIDIYIISMMIYIISILFKV